MIWRILGRWKEGETPTWGQDCQGMWWKDQLGHDSYRAHKHGDGLLNNTMKEIWQGPTKD